MSIVVVGINPGRKDASIRRLGVWGEVMGLRAFGFVNCIPYSPGGYRKEMIDYDWLAKAVAGSTVLALGGFASQALTKLGVDHFRLPHPSGRNRQTNDPVFIAAQLEAARKYIEERTTRVE